MKMIGTHTRLEHTHRHRYKIEIVCAKKIYIRKLINAYLYMPLHMFGKLYTHTHTHITNHLIN